MIYVSAFFWKIIADGLQKKNLQLVLNKPQSLVSSAFPAIRRRFNLISQTDIFNIKCMRAHKKKALLRALFKEQKLRR